jgi:UDP-N-acetylmuramate dehydrogenase
MKSVPQIQENYNMANHTTFKMGGNARFFAVVDDVEQLSYMYEFAQEKNLPVLVLGGGSNVVMSDGNLEYVVIKNNILGIEVEKDSDTEVSVSSGAGVDWDEFVQYCVAHSFQGVEALSLVPGSVGAAPVQNIGAYGQDVSQTILYVEVFDTQDKQIKQLSNEECQFDYRTSIFKTTHVGQYVITRVVFELQKSAHTNVPPYSDLIDFFGEQEIEQPTLQQVRDTVIGFRTRKLPKPEEVPNVGSFFKNPIILKDQADTLKEKFPEMVTFEIDDMHTKVGAAWLIDHAGLKGRQFGGLQVYPNNALVLTNIDNATFVEVQDYIAHVKKVVMEMFGIELEPEPLIIK